MLKYKWLGDMTPERLVIYVYLNHIRYRLNTRKYKGGAL